MTTKQMEIFLAAAKMENLKLVSEYLFMSPSTVSRQLALLEAEIDLQLFQRGNNFLRLTESGRIFMKTCESIMEQYTDGIEKARLLQRGEAGQLTLGYANADYWPDELIQITESFGLENPHIHVLYRSIPMNGFEQYLKNGRVDFVFGHNRIYDALPDISFYHLGYAQTGIYYSSRFPLPAGKKPEIQDFEGASLFVRDTKYLPNIRKVEKHYHLKNFDIQIMKNSSSILLNVSLGKGIAFLDAMILGTEKFHCFPLDESVICGDLCGYWYENNPNPCLSSFLKMMSGVRMELPC